MNFDLIKKHVNPATILDVGANVGHWHNEARLHWLNAFFFLIEGNPACAAQLIQTGAAVRIALLSDTEKEVDFFTRTDAPTCTGASYYRENTTFYGDDKATAQNLRTHRLDDVVGGREFDLIKLDTQGSELDILRGAPNTLSAAKAVIMEVSLTNYNEGAPQMAETVMFMEAHGFHLAENLGDIIHPIDRNVIQRDCLFLRV